MLARVRFVLGASCVVMTSCASTPDSVTTKTKPTATAALSASPSASALTDAPYLRAQRLVTQGPSCALLADGGVSCWAGELGPTPRRVPGVTDAARVVTGRGEIAILRKNGELVIGAEGAGAFAGITDAIAYSRDFEDRCVVRKDGSVACGPLGADTLTTIPGISDARDISVGRSHSCALVGAQGAVACFQQGAQKPFASPVKGLEGAVEVASGATVGCARKADNSIHCFSMQTPGWGAAPAGSATAMAVGTVYDGAPATFLCTASGKYARCRWVQSAGGELTRGSELFSITAAADIRQLSANAGGVCALDEAGAIVCTGRNSTGELGLPSFGFLETPTKLEGFSPLTAIVLGQNFACGLTRDGAVECAPRGLPPTRVPGFDAPLASLTGVGEVVCGTTSAGAVSCFRPALDQRPARRFPALDNSRALHSVDADRAVAVVSRDGRLSLGLFAYDMAKLTIRAVPGTHDLVDAKLDQPFSDFVGEPLFEIWLLDVAGNVEKGLVQALKLDSREKRPALDGTRVLGEQGRVIKKNGELWAVERMLRKVSPITSFIGDTSCGATKDDQLLCLDAVGHLSAKLGAAGDAATSGSARGASSNSGMACVIDSGGAPRCTGRDTLGIVEKQRRTQQSTEAHRIPLRASP